MAFWLKLGFISFGGPAGQIAIMHDELVTRRRWISENRFLHALNYTMVLPGPEAQQLATYLGWLMHGTRGGIVAGALFVLPSMLILMTLSWLYLAFGHVAVVAGVLYGIKPAVTAIVAHAAYRIGSRVLTNGVFVAIAVLAFVAIFVGAVPFPSIIVAAALVGVVGGRIAPLRFERAAVHSAVTSENTVPALIDDTTPTPAHARFSWLRLSGVVGTCLLIWCGVIGILAVRYGIDGTLTRMGWFFTKAALLTFGGAYAVLPYVYQGAVAQYGWLTATQMIDGLALGETTPGPLIMVVTYVGFIGGWTKAVLGPDALVLGGVVAGLVATLFTFLPSFLFILAGGPFVEATRHDLRLSAPLNSITAAVVGVIVNLALFFAYHVLWPGGFEGAFEWRALVIGALAVIALWPMRVGVIPVIVAAGLLGLLAEWSLG